MCRSKNVIMEVVMKNLSLLKLFVMSALYLTFSTKTLFSNNVFGMYVAKAIFFKWTPSAKPVVVNIQR